jgi:hypothetical protein
MFPVSPNLVSALGFQARSAFEDHEGNQAIRCSNVTNEKRVINPLAIFGNNETNALFCMNGLYWRMMDGLLRDSVKNQFPVWPARARLEIALSSTLTVSLAECLSSLFTSGVQTERAHYFSVACRHEGFFFIHQWRAYRYALSIFSSGEQTAGPYLYLAVACRQQGRHDFFKICSYRVSQRWLAHR